MSHDWEDVTVRFESMDRALARDCRKSRNMLEIFAKARNHQGAVRSKN
jgi:hypothetical protein